MTPNSVSSTSRRRFLTRATAIAATGINLITSHKAKAGDTNGAIVGEGEHRYEVSHAWPNLPDKYTWQTTHNVAVDSQNRLYAIHEGKPDQPDHPAIFVFDEKGDFIKAFGNQFQGGGHGIEVRKEDGGEFLYVTGYLHMAKFSKLTLDGEEVWTEYAPMQSGLYGDAEPKRNTRQWGREFFHPTNFAFLPDGSYFLADGYGAYTIHRYGTDGKWQSNIGSPGKGDGEFNTPHGLWIDDRKGGDVQLVVCDRGNGRMQWFDLDGTHRQTMGGFMLPANIDRFGDLLLIPDLSARITLLNGDNKMIHLGEDPDWRKEVLKDKKAMRSQPASWVSGKFVHPHDACFDANGNIFVAEWVASGRISKLRKVS
ncbi:MAG: hypothetical protein CMO55_14170 [Verrucomicrobiales bacterium]|nr:hypothetical protein [Verrucomicrobiales bacterium]